MIKLKIPILPSTFLEHPVINTAEDANKLVGEVARILKMGTRPKPQREIDIIVEAGTLGVEAILQRLVSEEGVTRLWADMDYTKRRNRGEVDPLCIRFSFSERTLDVLGDLADILVRIGQPAVPEIIEVVRGKWIPQFVKLMKTKVCFSPRKHEGIMVLLEKMARPLLPELREILVHGAPLAQEAVVYTLRFLPEPDVVKMLIETAVTTKHLDVHFVSQRSLAFIGTKDPLLLVEQLHSPNDEARKNLIQSLIYTEHPDLIKIFIEHYPKETHEICQSDIIEYLRWHKDPQVLSLLQKVAENPNSLPGRSARYALEWMTLS